MLPTAGSPARGLPAAFAARALSSPVGPQNCAEGQPISHALTKGRSALRESFQPRRATHQEVQVEGGEQVLEVGVGRVVALYVAAGGCQAVQSVERGL